MSTEEIDREFDKLMMESDASKDASTAEAVVKEPEIKPRLTRLECCSEICRIIGLQGGLKEEGLWFGVNNNEITRDGSRIGQGHKLVALSEVSWKKMLTSLTPMGLTAKVIKDADGNYTHQTKIDGMDTRKNYLIVFYGVESIENDGEGTGDPRKNLISNALLGLKFNWNYVFVYAHISDADIKPLSFRPGPLESVPCKTTGEPHEEHDAPVSSPGSPPRRNIPAKKSNENEWYAPAPAPAADSPVPEVPESPINNTEKSDAMASLRNRAAKLNDVAKQLNALGYYQVALQTSNEAVECVIKAEKIERASVIETTYYPVVEYLYPDGSKREIAAGNYTEQEHMLLTIKEQDLWAEAKQSDKKKSDERQSLQKYEKSLTRSISQSEAISNVETELKKQVAESSSRSRNLMAAISASREVSPKEMSPKHTSASDPTQVDKISFTLPPSVVDTKKAMESEVESEAEEAEPETKKRRAKEEVVKEPEAPEEPEAEEEEPEAEEVEEEVKEPEAPEEPEAKEEPEEAKEDPEEVKEEPEEAKEEPEEAKEEPEVAKEEPKDTKEEPEDTKEEPEEEVKETKEEGDEEDTVVVDA